MTRIYTRRGDDGETSLFGGARVAKAHPRVEAYGTVDELNAAVGEGLARVADDDTSRRLARIQHDLFTIGAVLAAPGGDDPPGGRDGGSGKGKVRIPGVPEDRVGEMEEWIDAAVDEAGPLRGFVLPGGTAAAAGLHLARTVCRRAERAVVALAGEEDVHPGILRYLNRLSDLLFALARLENHRHGEGDVEWEKEGLEGGRQGP